MTKKVISIAIFIVFIIFTFLFWYNSARFSSLQENAEFASTSLEHYVELQLDGYSISNMRLEADYPKKKITSFMSLLSNEDVWIYNWEAKNQEDVALGKIVTSASGRTIIFGELSNGEEIGSISY